MPRTITQLPFWHNKRLCVVHSVIQALFDLSLYQESVVAKVVRRWVLGQWVAGSNPGWAAVFAFMGKMLNLNCPSLHPGV